MTAFSTADQQLLAALSPQAQSVLLSTLQGNSPAIVPVASNPYVGPGGITFDTAGAVRNLLFTKQFNPNDQVYLANGTPVTIAMLRSTRVRHRRPSDGQFGNDYTLIWELSEDTAGELIKYLESLPDDPSARRSNGNRGRRTVAGNAPQAPVTDPRLDRIEALVLNLISQLGGEDQLVQAPQVPVAPVAPVAGHTIGNVPVFSAAPIQQQVTQLVPGMAVMTTDGIRYVSDDGKRLNKTASD